MRLVVRWRIRPNGQRRRSRIGGKKERDCCLSCLFSHLIVLYRLSVRPKKDSTKRQFHFLFLRPPQRQPLKSEEWRGWSPSSHYVVVVSFALNYAPLLLSLLLLLRKSREGIITVTRRRDMGLCCSYLLRCFSSQSHSDISRVLLPAYSHCIRPSAGDELTAAWHSTDIPWKKKWSQQLRWRRPRLWRRQ